MNHQTHSPTSILTEDPLQALYQCNSFSVKASQMYMWCRYGGLRRHLYNGSSCTYSLTNAERVTVRNVNKGQHGK